MRATVVVLVSALGSAGATASAQGSPLSHLSFPGSKPVFTVRTYSLDPGPTSVRWQPAIVCPMPVYRTGKVTDPMPIAPSGTPEPMPVARSGCSNPLDPQ